MISTVLPPRYPIQWLADRFGIVWSGLCALHCIALPFAFALAPSLLIALHSHRDPNHALALVLLSITRWEWLIALSAAAIAILSTARGLQVHARRGPLALALLGTGALATATQLPLVSADEVWHACFAATGGALLIAAHVRNLRAFRGARQQPA